MSDHEQADSHCRRIVGFYQFCKAFVGLSGWVARGPAPLSCWEVVKQGQGHSAWSGARLYGADASDDPAAGSFAVSVDLHSTSDADTLDDEDLCGKARSTVCYIYSVQG